MILWKSIIDPDHIPPMAVRVLVKRSDGFVMIGKLTVHGWRDDNAMPIHNVELWSAIL